MDDIIICDETVQLPVRSAFAKQEPQGIGGGNVESLWGYFTRLAAGHGFSLFGLLCRLMPERIAGSVKEAESVKMAFYHHYCSVRMNGPAAARQLLDQIAGRLPVSVVELESLSCLVLGQAMNNHAQNRATRAWCGDCFLEDKVPYERLAWTWGAVTCCNIHRVPLSSACSSCGAAQRFRGTGAGVGKCEQCGESLANATATSAEKADAFDLHLAETAFQILALAQGRGIPTDVLEIFWRNVWAQADFVGNRASYARLLGFTQNTLVSAHQVNRVPNLLFLAKVSWLGRVRIDSFLTRPLKCQELAEPAWGRIRAPYKKREPADSDVALTTFLELVRGDPYRPVSVTAVCKASRVCNKHPSFKFPLVQELMRAQRKAATGTRRALFTWQYCDRVRRAILAVEAKGGTPCTSRLNRALDVPGVLRNADARRIRDGFLRAVQRGLRGVLQQREMPLYLRVASKSIK